MEWSKSNKENADPSNRIRTIASAFRVKKCLFDSKVTDGGSPASPTLSLSSRLNYIGPIEESPYALFRIKKKKSHVLSVNSSSNSSKEHSQESGVTTTPTHKKRNRKLSNDEGKYSQSTEESPSNSGVIELAVQKSMLNPNLTGDFSKVCILPTISGRHPDLMTVTPETIGNLLQEQESFAYKIIDCRYPYEFQGG
ncbi:M-phase inducer phosphatase 3, partial [Stegodyphus mimosarum]